MKRLLRRPSPALVIACIALLVGLGPAAYAGHLSPFLLGHANFVGNNATSLSGNHAGKLLQVTNNSTAAGSTALGLNVGAGRTPFTVNSGTKVANLNADRLDGLDSTAFLRRTGKAADADKLDGIDSAGFVQGKGAVYRSRYFTADQTDRTIFITIPGLASVGIIECDLNIPRAAAIVYFPAPVSVWRDTGVGDPGYFAVSTAGSWITEQGAVKKTVFHLSRGFLASTQSATVEILTMADSSQCEFSVTAIVYG